MFKNSTKKFFSWFKSNKKNNDGNNRLKENKTKNNDIEKKLKQHLVGMNKNQINNSNQIKINNCNTNICKNNELIDFKKCNSIDSNSSHLNNIGTSSSIKPCIKKKSLIYILTKKLINTKNNLGCRLSNLFIRKKISDSIYDKLEEQLLISDVGVNTTKMLISNVIKKSSKQELNDSQLVFSILKNNMIQCLKLVEKPLNIIKKYPFVILVVGVNGVGKTSLIGKLTYKYRKEGKTVMLAAGDTFRAAAIDQLKYWGEQSNVSVIAKNIGSDPASVVFDALQASKSKNIDILIIDTAGRLHNKIDLMRELDKIKTVIKKADNTAPHEIMLVLDAFIGQNSLNQTKFFNESLGITGLTITKLDGTAKGGVIFSIAHDLLIPIRYISFGEKLKDIQVFNSECFVDAILDK